MYGKKRTQKRRISEWPFSCAAFYQISKVRPWTFFFRYWTTNAWNSKDSRNTVREALYSSSRPNPVNYSTPIPQSRWVLWMTNLCDNSSRVAQQGREQIGKPLTSLPFLRQTHFFHTTSHMEIKNLKSNRKVNAATLAHLWVNLIAEDISGYPGISW